VAERTNAAVSKTVSGLWVRRGFESLPLRLARDPMRFVVCSRPRSRRSWSGELRGMN
jgi:hypothetical protein